MPKNPLLKADRLLEKKGDCASQLAPAEGGRDTIDEALQNMAERESHESGIVSAERNALEEEHARQFPEGDPAVRRIKPDRGEIPITEVSGGRMKVYQKQPGSPPAAKKRRAA